jgi:hypothetical protein
VPVVGLGSREGWTLARLGGFCTEMIGETLLHDLTQLLLGIQVVHEVRFVMRKGREARFFFERYIALVRRFGPVQ